MSSEYLLAATLSTYVTYMLFAKFRRSKDELSILLERQSFSVDSDKWPGIFCVDSFAFQSLEGDGVE